MKNILCAIFLLFNLSYSQNDEGINSWAGDLDLLIMDGCRGDYVGKFPKRKSFLVLEICSKTYLKGKFNGKIGYTVIGSVDPNPELNKMIANYYRNNIDEETLSSRNTSNDDIFPKWIEEYGLMVAWKMDRGTIWNGMSQDQVEDMFGYPIKKTNIKPKDIWQNIMYQKWDYDDEYFLFGNRKLVEHGELK